MLTPGADSSTSGRISKTPCMRSVIARSVVHRRAQATRTRVFVHPKNRKVGGSRCHHVGMTAASAVLVPMVLPENGKKISTWSKAVVQGVETY